MRVSAVAALVVASLALAGCDSSNPNVLQGWVEADLVFVSPDEQGRVELLKVREGDSVAKGQMIARVVDSRLGYETNAYAAQAAAAVARAEAARAELSRIDYLYRRGVYAKARLDEAQAAARSADAQVRAAQSQRSASAAVARQGAILAPAAGRVLRADIPQGSVVAPGTSVATITAGPPLLKLDLPESLARQLGKGAEVTIRDADELDGRRGRCGGR